jgi:MFS family permease
MTLLIIVVAPIAGRMTDRFGSRWFMTGGMVLIAAQLLYFSRLGANASYWELLPAMMIGGIGMASTMTPSAAAATRSVPVDKAGVGSAVLNAFRQVGGTMGIAVMGAIMAHKAGGTIPPPGSVLTETERLAAQAAFMSGFQAALLVASVIAAVGAIVAFVLVRPHEEARRPEEADVPASELAA